MSENLLHEKELSEHHTRPQLLEGVTYKIHPALLDHSVFVTINDIYVYDDNDKVYRRPFEVFINSKNVDHFAHDVAITRLISAIFRKGGECKFIVDELKNVHDPKGGYFIPKSGGKYASSVIAHIAHTIEEHMRQIGYLSDEQDEHLQAMIADKKQQYENQTT